MKENVLKVALMLCASFVLGNMNFQDTSTALNAGVIPKIKRLPPIKLVPEIPEIDLQILKV